MNMITNIPPQAPISLNGRVSREWYRFFTSLTSFAQSTPALPMPSAANENELLAINSSGSAYTLLTASQALTAIGAAPANGSASTPFLVGTATPGTADAIPITQADARYAAANVVPAPGAGDALDYVRVNAAGSAYETRTPAQTLGDIAAASVAGSAATAFLVGTATPGTSDAISINQADARYAAAGVVPAPGAGNELDYVRVNAAGTAYETRTPSQTLSDIAAAPLASPTFTGTPAAPTPAAGTSTMQIATTAFALTGNASGSAAAAGQIGEFVSVSVASGSAVALTSGTPVNIAALALTAGDWDVWGTVVFAPAGTTTATAYAAWTSATSATAPPLPNNGAYSAVAGLSFAAGAQQAKPVNAQQINVSSSTTIYLSAEATFATSTMAAFGFICARRRR